MNAEYLLVGQNIPVYFMLNDNRLTIIIHNQHHHYEADYQIDLSEDDLLSLTALFGGDEQAKLGGGE